MSVLILALWGVGYALPAAQLPGAFTVTPLAAVAAALTAALSMVAYVWGSAKVMYGLSLGSYLLLCATSLTIIITTGNLSSIFLALWLVVVVFAGLFGYAGVAPLTAVTVGYAVYLFTYLHGGREQGVVFFTAFVLPLGISYGIWRKKSFHENEKDQAYSALAHELSQVSSQSDIVITAIADGVMAVDDKGLIQLINPAALNILGWDRQDAVGLDYHLVLKLLDHQDRPPEGDADIILRVLRSNQTAGSDELSATTSSGKKLMVSLLVSPIGKLGSGVIVVFRDITAAKAEEREQAEFISTASHEMRTPVAAIEGYLGLALNPSTATIDEKARAYLSRAHESAQHLGRLFQDLLDVSKAEDGRLSSNPAVVEMTALVRDVVNGLQPSAQAKGLVMLYGPDLGTHASDRLAPVLYCDLDADHLRETLANLIENAIKYTPQGDITVDVTGDSEHVVIRVKDSGLGIPSEDIPHLFQKFYRVDNTDTREIGGTGLGLYLCRRLTEAMGGRIWVESEYGHGSTFSLEFPRLSQQAANERLEEVEVETVGAPAA